MGTNHLEELIAEWYEFNGYFVRRNVLVGKRSKGGYECELDLVAFHPEKKELIQIEPSLDAHSWKMRETRYRKKFRAGRKYIPELFTGLDIAKNIRQVAVFIMGDTTSHPTLAGGKVRHVSEIIREIVTELEKRKVYSSIVPEQFPLLRSIQFVVQYRKQIWPELT